MAFLLRCSHKQTSFPITRPRKAPQARRLKNTYMVCLTCGAELPYSWSEMRMVKERRRPVAEMKPNARSAVPA
jgi:hypothetical protein